jgi:acylphosphatase
MRAGRFEAAYEPAQRKKSTAIRIAGLNGHTWPLHDGTKQSVSATIRKFVSDTTQARRYFVSGMVQGVGFRFYAQHAAEKLRLNGYVRNLRDGRVEVYALGSAEQLAGMRAALERGARFSSVTEVREEPAQTDPKYAKEFIITYDE